MKFLEKRKMWKIREVPEKKERKSAREAKKKQREEEKQQKAAKKASQKRQNQKTASGSRVTDQKQKASHTHQTALCAHCVTGSMRKERTVQCQWSGLDARSGSTSKAVYWT